MILFTILLITFIVLLVFSILALSAGGAAMIIIFGDVIVCMFLIVWIMKAFFKKRK